MNLDGEASEASVLHRQRTPLARRSPHRWLRLDAVHAAVDDSASFLAELSAAIDELAAHLGRIAFVAESDMNDPMLTISSRRERIG
jgi:hypothetical protein